MSHKGQRGAPYVKKNKGNDDDRFNPSSEGKGKERPTRTLFVRNINYNISESEVYELFAKFGELKRFFNLIEKRGMAFITYWDTRAADRAKKEMQNFDLNGRSIDIHYALPKDEDKEDEDEERNTGTLFVTLRNVAGGSLNELRQYFEKFGDVREVRDCRNSPNQKFVEYYDLRDCEKAYNEAHQASFNGGSLDVKYAYAQKPITRDPDPSYPSNSHSDHTTVSTQQQPLPSLPPVDPMALHNLLQLSSLLSGYNPLLMQPDPTYSLMQPQVNPLHQMYMTQPVQSKPTTLSNPQQVQYTAQQPQQSISPNPAAIQQLLSMLTQPSNTTTTTSSQGNQGTNPMYNPNPYLRK